MRLLLIISSIITLASCNLYQDVELLDVADVRLSEFGMSGVGAELDLVINNPNNYAVNLTDTDVKVWINDMELGQVRLAEKLKLEKKQEGRYVMRVHSNKEDLSPMFLSGMLSLLFSAEAKFKAQGFVKGRGLIFAKKVEVDMEETILLEP